ncbi:MAG: hypothetical protein QM778_02150 [Myxococcales bacterium]
MGRITSKLLLLAGAIAGVTACQSDPMKGVESAQDQAAAHAVEAQEDRAELARKQAEQRAELAHDQHEKAVDEAQRVRTQPAAEQLEDNNALALKQAAERADLGSEQASDRGDMVGDIERQRQRDMDRLARANDQASEEKRAFAEKAREKLRKLEDRANKLSAKRGEAEPDEQASVNKTLLTDLPAKCQEAEREITSLESVGTRADWAKAKSEVQNTLASIERSLDRVDRML